MELVNQFSRLKTTPKEAPLKKAFDEDAALREWPLYTEVLTPASFKVSLTHCATVAGTTPSYGLKCDKKQFSSPLNLKEAVLSK